MSFVPQVDLYGTTVSNLLAVFFSSPFFFSFFYTKGSPFNSGSFLVIPLNSQSTSVSPLGVTLLEVRS